MSKRIRKILSLLMAVLLVTGIMFGNVSFKAKADNNCLIKVEINNDAPDRNYNLDVTPLDNAGNPIAGGNINFNNTGGSNTFAIIDAASSINFKLQTAGNTLNSVSIGGQALDDEAKAAIVSQEGYTIAYGGDSSLTVSLNISGQQNNDPGDPPAGPAAPANPVDISVSLDDQDHVCAGIRIDGYNMDPLTKKVTVNDGQQTRDIGICVEFGMGISKVEINGTVITDIPQDNQGWITFTGIADASTYTIKVYKGDSDDITMLWVYDQETADKKGFGTDSVVENGKVELVSIKRGEEVVYDEQTEDSQLSIDEDGGYVMLKKGDDVTVRLIPNYGYQLKSVSVNGNELTPQKSVSTFELRGIQGNIHFSGAFVKKDDVTVSTSSIAKSPVISDGGNAASSGNLSLSISDNTAYTTDVTGAVSGATAKKVASLDLSLDNIVSKGNGENWTTNITEFTNPISISIDVSDEELEDGETYGIVRDHNGTLTELDATYVDGKLTFKTNQFSTYTIIKKTESKIVSEVIKDSDISAGLKHKGINTLEKIEKEFIEVLKNNKITAESGKYVVVDVKMKMLKNGVWVDADASNFPAEGLEIEIPFDMSKIPEGAKVTVAHMFSETIGDSKAGDVEILTSQLTSTGIKVKVNGLSPFMITWTTTPEAPTKTGDSNNIALWLFMTVISMISAIYFSRRQYKRV